MVPRRLMARVTPASRKAPTNERCDCVLVPRNKAFILDRWDMMYDKRQTLARESGKNRNLTAAGRAASSREPIGRNT